MTWLLFIDESGHDHKAMPLEVRGGIALHVSKLWGFIQGWQRLELDCFGARLADYGTEAKGYKLLDKDRFKWAAQTRAMLAEDRRKAARVFLHKGREKAKPTSTEFAGYGQASLEMARGVFDLLTSHEARLFACAIPKGTKQPSGYALDDYLRKDHVFLFERFFYFLEARKEHGLIVMDETDKKLDRQFVSRMESYFTRTATGRNRSHWIVPAPLFVSSDITFAVQAADICLYALNWGFRPNKDWKNLERRADIATEFGPKLLRLQWEGDGYREGQVFRSYGIVLVRDPFEQRPKRPPPS
jgi:hypothetical protein